MVTDHTCQPPEATTTRVHQWQCAACGAVYAVAVPSVGRAWWEQVRGPEREPK